MIIILPYKMESKFTDAHFKTTKISTGKNISRAPYLGLIYTLFYSLCFSLPSVIVKKMTYVNPSQLSLVRSSGILSFSIPILMFTRKNWMGPKECRRLLFARGLMGASSIHLSHLAYRLLPLSEAAIILATIPAMVMIGARFYLKETYGLISSCALVLTFVGVLLSVNVPELLQNKGEARFTLEYLGGIAAALGGVFCFTFSSLIARKLKDVHFSVVLIYASVIGVIGNVCLTSTFSVFELPRCGWDSLLTMSVGILGFASHSFLILAIQSEPVAIVSVVSCSLNILFGLIFQLVFFSRLPDVFDYCGALVVMLAVCTIGFSKWLRNQPSESQYRNKFRFLLL